MGGQRRAPVDQPRDELPDRAAHRRAETGGHLRPATGVVARWPLAGDEAGALGASGDAYAGLVRQSIESYRVGRADMARQTWADDIVWRVAGAGPVSGEHRGADGIFGYHERLGRLSGGTFRQRLLLLDTAGGPIVNAYLWTEAGRDGRALAIPTLIVFEIGGLRVRRITELPGDQAAWDAFWAD